MTKSQINKRVQDHIVSCLNNLPPICEGETREDTIEDFIESSLKTLTGIGEFGKVTAQVVDGKVLVNVGVDTAK